VAPTERARRRGQPGRSLRALEGPAGRTSGRALVHSLPKPHTQSSIRLDRVPPGSGLIQRRAPSNSAGLGAIVMAGKPLATGPVRRRRRLRLRAPQPHMAAGQRGRCSVRVRWRRSNWILAGAQSPALPPPPPPPPLPQCTQTLASYSAGEEPACVCARLSGSGCSQLRAPACPAGRRSRSLQSSAQLARCGRLAALTIQYSLPGLGRHQRATEVARQRAAGAQFCSLCKCRLQTNKVSAIRPLG